MRVAYTLNGLIGGLSGKNSSRTNEDDMPYIIDYVYSFFDKNILPYNTSVDFFIFSWQTENESDFEKTFAPNYFFELDKVSIEKKIKALKCYKSEIGKHPFSRSALNIKSLALYRGSQAGTYYAEAFKIIRLIKTK